MPTIRQQRCWARKPPTTTRINYASPYLQGAQILLSADASVQRSDLFGNSLTYTDATFPPYDTGWAIQGAGSEYIYTLIPPVFPTTACTVAMVVRPGVSGETGAAFGANQNAPNRCLCHFPYGSTVYWDFGDSTGVGRVSWSPAA